MRTRCERRSCTAVATAAVAVDPPNQTVWIGDLEGSAPHVTVFCTACADALLVPSGWHRRDVRESPRLFADRVMPWEKAAAELAARNAGPTDADPAEAPAKPKRKRTTTKRPKATEGDATAEESVQRAPRAPRTAATRPTSGRRSAAADPAQQRLDDVAVTAPAEEHVEEPVEETPPAARLLAVMPAEAQETDEPMLNPSAATPLLARAFNQHRPTR